MAFVCEEFSATTLQSEMSQDTDHDSSIREDDDACSLSEKRVSLLKESVGNDGQISAAQSSLSAFECSPQLKRSPMAIADMVSGGNLSNSNSSPQPSIVLSGAALAKPDAKPLASNQGPYFGKDQEKAKEQAAKPCQNMIAPLTMTQNIRSLSPGDRTRFQLSMGNMQAVNDRQVLRLTLLNEIGESGSEDEFGYQHPETPIQAPIDRKKQKMKTVARPIAAGLSVAPLQSPQARKGDTHYQRMFRKMRKGEESKSEGADNQSDEGSDIEMRLGGPDGASHEQDEESDSDDFPSELIAIDNLESIEAEFNEANKVKGNLEDKGQGHKYNSSPLKPKKDQKDKKVQKAPKVSKYGENPSPDDGPQSGECSSKIKSQVYRKKSKASHLAGSKRSNSESSSDSFIQEVSKPLSPAKAGQKPEGAFFSDATSAMNANSSRHQASAGRGAGDSGSGSNGLPQGDADNQSQPKAAKSTTKHDLDEIYKSGTGQDKSPEESSPSISEDSEAITLNSQLQEGESASIREYRKVRARQQSPRQKGDSVRGLFGQPADQSRTQQQVQGLNPSEDRKEGFKLQKAGTLDC